MIQFKIVVAYSMYDTVLQGTIQLLLLYNTYRYYCRNLKKRDEEEQQQMVTEKLLIHQRVTATHGLQYTKETG